MQNKTLNYGKIAYDETNEIRREIYNKPKKYNLNVRMLSRQSFTANDEIIKKAEFYSEKKELINITFNFKINSYNTNNLFKLKLLANNAVLNTLDIDSTYVKTFSFSFNFFAYEKNTVKIKLISNGLEVLFDDIEIYLKGQFEINNNVNYSNFLLESENINGEVVLFHKKDNVFHKFSYSNLNHLISEFSEKNIGYIVVEDVIGLAYNLVNSAGSNKNQELFLLQKNLVSNNIAVTNESKSKSLVVSNNLNNVFCLQGVSFKNEISLMCFELSGQMLNYKALNNNLNVVLGGSEKLNLKNGVEKLVPIYYKNSSNLIHSDLIIITNKKEAYFVQCQYNSNLNLFEISPNIIYIGKASDAYAVFVNNTLNVFLVYENEVSHLTFKYYANTINKKKISEKVLYNAQLGFISNENKAFYYYLKNFELEQIND